jgi:hypothetical protein
MQQPGRRFLVQVNGMARRVFGHVGGQFTDSNENRKQPVLDPQ